MENNVTNFLSDSELFLACSARVEELVRALIGEDRISVVFSGGKTPGRLFNTLRSNKNIDWTKIDILLADERFVSLNDENSNYKLLDDGLLRHIDVPCSNVFRADFMASLEGSRLDYESKIIKRFGTDPVFDLIFLGMGEDGHTASLFPANVDKGGVVVSAEEKVAGFSRVSLSLNTINSTKEKIFLITGKNKEATFLEVLGGEHAAGKVCGNVKYFTYWE